ncbi:MAG: DRTGG domain-containing protein [Candidatus Thorarchaeota archaeon]
MVSGATLTGKTMTVVALASKLKGRGARVAYFKPFGEHSLETPGMAHDVEPDAVLMKEFLGMTVDEQTISPLIYSPSTHSELLKAGHDALAKRIRECYQKVSQDADYVLLESPPRPWDLLHLGFSSPQLAKMFDASVLCLVTLSEPSAIDEVLLHRDFFVHHGVDSVGMILFMVPPMLRALVSDEIGPRLKSLGVNVCGVVFQNRELFAPSIRDIVTALRGELLVTPERMDTPIGQFVVGSMEPDNALKWFRRTPDKAVITSGDRSDVCLAALETDTRLLILTGGLEPDVRTVSQAKSRGVPILLTSLDTYSVSQIVDKLVGTIAPGDTERIAAAQRLIGDAVDFSCMLPKD